MSELVANAGTILLAVLGISLLIFVHEAGHFLAARLFKVRVETFSLGFGPRIFGMQRGDTEYRVSAIPLGGYVKMAGEYSDFMEDGDRVLDEDDLNSKPIWQRFIIFAAGPAVNFLLAFLLFPIGFASGAPFVAPIVGDITQGGAAWSAGLQTGDQVVSINGNRVYGFTDVALEIALSDPDNTSAIIRRDGREFSQDFELLHNESQGRYDLGIRPHQLPVLRLAEGGSAENAGLQAGDILVGVEDLRVGSMEDGKLVSPSQCLISIFNRSDAVTVHVERDGRALSFVMEPESVELENPKPQLGAWPAATRVGGLRQLASQAGFPLKEGDLVEHVNGVEVMTGESIRKVLRDTPDALQTAFRIRRDGASMNITLGTDDLAAILARDVIFAQDIQGPLRIQPVAGGSLLAAGMQDGDLIVALNGQSLDNFADLQKLVGDHPEQVDYRVEFLRAGEQEKREVSVRAHPLPAYQFGLSSTTHEVVYDFDFAGNMKAGLDSSINSIRQTGLTLAKLFTGEVGTENLGGPLAISVITYEAAKWSFAKLLMFLAALSVNLGFINSLPIPVLDGGQIVFLLCEKAKGSRLSERFMQNAQLAGFVAILALMVYVTINDFVRFT